MLPSQTDPEVDFGLNWQFQSGSNGQHSKTVTPLGHTSLGVTRRYKADVAFESDLWVVC